MRTDRRVAYGCRPRCTDVPLSSVPRIAANCENHSHNPRNTCSFDMGLSPERSSTIYLLTMIGYSCYHVYATRRSMKHPRYTHPSYKSLAPIPSTAPYSTRYPFSIVRLRLSRDRPLPEIRMWGRSIATQFEPHRHLDVHC